MSHKLVEDLVYWSWLVMYTHHSLFAISLPPSPPLGLFVIIWSFASLHLSPWKFQNCNSNTVTCYGIGEFNALLQYNFSAISLFIVTLVRSGEASLADSCWQLAAGELQLLISKLPSPAPPFRPSISTSPASTEKAHQTQLLQHHKHHPFILFPSSFSSFSSFSFALPSSAN